MAVALSHRSSDERAALSALLLLRLEEGRMAPEAADTLLQLHKHDATLANGSKRKFGDTQMEEKEQPRKKRSIENVYTPSIESRLQEMVDEGVPGAERRLGKLRKGQYKDRGLKTLRKFVGLQDGDESTTADSSNISSRTLSPDDTTSNKKTTHDNETISNDDTVSDNSPPRYVRPSEHTRPVREESVAGPERHTWRDGSSSRINPWAVPVAGAPGQRNIGSERYSQSAFADETADSWEINNQYGPRRFQSTSSGPNAHLWAHSVVGKGIDLSRPPTSPLTDPFRRDDNVVTPAASTTGADAATMPGQSSLGRELQLHPRNRELYGQFTDTEDETDNAL